MTRIRDVSSGHQGGELPMQKSGGQVYRLPYYEALLRVVVRGNKLERIADSGILTCGRAVALAPAHLCAGTLRAPLHFDHASTGSHHGAWWRPG